MPQKRITPADHLCGMLDVNVDNEKMNDARFREFVRESLEIGIYKAPPHRGYEADRRAEVTNSTGSGIWHFFVHVVYYKYETGIYTG